jgi:exonuclease VII small subunit
MTQEAFEKAKALEKEIAHTEKVIEFIKENRCVLETPNNTTDIFITNALDDGYDLNKDEVETIIEALENRVFQLNQEFVML